MGGTCLEDLRALEEACESIGCVDAESVSAEMDFVEGGGVDVGEEGRDVGGGFELEASAVERKGHVCFPYRAILCYRQHVLSRLNQVCFFYLFCFAYPAHSPSRSMGRSGQRAPKRPPPDPHSAPPTTTTTTSPLYLSSPFVDAALVKGNFKTIVMLPKYVDIMEWVAVNSPSPFPVSPRPPLMAPSL